MSGVLFPSSSKEWTGDALAGSSTFPGTAGVVFWFVSIVNVEIAQGRNEEGWRQTRSFFRPVDDDDMNGNFDLEALRAAAADRIRR